MALINQNSIIGVTSITSPSASNVLTFHTNDTTERLRVTPSGVSFSGTNASLDTSGNLTVGGNVNVAGVLTYEDVTSVDSVGIVTAQSGINVTGTTAIGNEQLQLTWTSPNGAIKAKNTVGSPAANLDFYSTDTGGDTNLGIRLQYTGNVAIGTDNPATRLDVYKDFSGISAGNYAGRIYGTDSGVDETGVRFVTKGTGDLHNASDAYLIHGISNGDTKFVFNANGYVGIGTDYRTYDDTSDTNIILDIYGGDTLNKRGILSLSGRTSTADLDLGSIWFNNHDNNNGSSTGNTMKLVSAIQSRAVTSDSNAQNDSGGYLQFYTKPETGPLAERVRITAGGDIVVGSGFTNFQPTIQGESPTTRPYKLVFQNQYSNAQTDDQLKLYLFNSGATRQGFGPGPNYDIQYHSSGAAANQARHRFYTDNVLRMEISDVYDGVTKPTQPGFYARRTTAGDGRAAGVMTEWHISGTGSYNEGSHFKTTGSDAGRFVAPVTGKYYFAAQPGYKQTGQDFNFYFRVNNTVISEPVRVIDGGDDLTSHSAFTGSCIVHLTAGQKFDVYIGYTHHANTTFNYFCGYLIG